MDLSSLIAKLLENLASEEVVDFTRGMEGMGEQLENVENILSSIRTVLDDADKKQLDDDLVKEWCMQVEDAAFDLDDVIVEINANALKRKLVGKSGFSYDKKPLESQIQNILAKLEYIGERKDMLRLKEVVDKKRPQGSDPAPSRKNSGSDHDGNTSYSNIRVPRWNRDVYVSFRGEDVRHNFADHIFKALKLKGIDFFRDDETEIDKGKEIPPLLLKVIEESRIAIVILSPNYASSTWCLDELAFILQCHEKKGMIILPVFYRVDPSEVRNQTQHYGMAFARHEERFNVEKVSRWRNVLITTANMFGWVSGDRYESVLIDNIVEKILKITNVTCSSVNNDLVGMGLRLEETLSYLCMGQSDVRTLGISGTGGIGKTTLANEVFSSFQYQFESSCFLADVRQEYRKHGLVHLQEQLYEILLDTKAKIQNVNMGINILRRRLRNLRVLIILDDVNRLDQIEALVGKAEDQHNWLGPGSRVIVTTRYKQLLVTYGAHSIQEIEKLSEEEALKLFCREAFQENHPRDHDYEKLSMKIVKLANGNPLALKFFGSSLRGRRKNEWSHKVNHIKKSLNMIESNLPKEVEPDEFSKISYRTTTSERISLLSKQKQLLLAKGSSFQSPPVIPSKSQKSLSPSSFSNIHEQYDWLLRDEGIGAIDLTTRNEQLPKSDGEENLDESVKLQDSLDLSENRQGDIPRYISVLSSLRNLTQVLPFSEPNKLELLTVQSSGEDKQMPLEPTDVLFPALIQEIIIDGKLFGISFPCKRIPNWSTYGSSKSSISVTLSPHDNYSSMEGMAFFVVFEIKADEDFDKGSELNAISCYFQVDECLLENPIVFENFKNFGVGSFGICCYIPQQWFAGKLTKASTTIEASISKERHDVELKMCGIHPIYGLDIEEFSKNLAQTANEHRVVVWDLSRHCNELLDCRTKLESFGDMISNEYDRCEELTTSTEPLQEAEQNESDSTTERRRDIQSLLSRLFQGRYAQNNHFYFTIPIRFLSLWFFHHSLGDVAICYLPPNLYNDESWVGLELYVLFKRRPTVACNNTPDSDQTTSLLLVDLYAHGDTTLPILTYPLLIDDAFFGSHSVFFHIPRECFPEKLNQCKGISTLFRPSTPDLEVEVCGTRLLYKQDSESLIQVILDSAQGREEAFDLLSEQVQMYLKAETSQRDEVEQEGPHFGLFSSFEREQIEWLQKHLTSTEQASEEVRTLLHKYIFCVAHNQDYKDFDPILLHSRHWFLDNQCQIRETIGKGSSRGLVSSFNHLHIMAETLVALGSNLVYWKEDLQLLLKELFKKSVLVSLSFKGHIISVLKNFDVCSTYNFCFPRKEILDWFELRNSASTLRIELNDKSWSGLAICAAFFIHPYNKHQIISSDMPLKILCHLTTSGKYCLNPVPVFSISKEKLKWLDHGLVWLTYIPHKLLIELNGESSVVARIYSEAPYLKVKTCGVRLLYDQDVDQFKETIIQCWTSFFDNLDSMSQFVAYEDDEKLSGSSNEVTK